MQNKFARLVANSAGFTLIELFTAMFLLTIGLLGTAALTAGVVKGNTASRNISTAAAIAQSCFQENRRVGYTSAGSVPSGGSNSCTSGTSTVTQGTTSFTRTLTITTGTNIKTLDMTVQWQEGAAGTKSISMSTIIASGT